eukprot:SM000042S15362  [mRNA]  locus=s42:487741:488795:- [translate_table: standard]
MTIETQTEGQWLGSVTLSRQPTLLGVPLVFTYATGTLYFFANASDPSANATVDLPDAYANDRVTVQGVSSAALLPLSELLAAPPLQPPPPAAQPDAGTGAMAALAAAAPATAAQPRPPFAGAALACQNQQTHQGRIAGGDADSMTRLEQAGRQCRRQNCWAGFGGPRPALAPFGQLIQEEGCGANVADFGDCSRPGIHGRVRLNLGRESYNRDPSLDYNIGLPLPLPFTTSLVIDSSAA